MVTSLEVPTTAAAELVSCMVLFDVVVAGVKVALTPAGKLLTKSYTLPVNPYSGLTAIVELAWEDLVRFAVLGYTESVKPEVSAPLSVSIRLGPRGLPQPVTRS
jgi:hypothetical protein